jgi:hypothetical protein
MCITCSLVCTRTVVRVNTNSTYETFHKEHVQSLGYGRQRLGRDGSEVAEIENSNFVESPSYKAAQTLSRSVTSERHLSGVHVIERYKYENITTETYMFLPHMHWKDHLEAACPQLSYLVHQSTTPDSTEPDQMQMLTHDTPKYLAESERGREGEEVWERREGL